MWKFTLDLTHPVEDGILDSANFVSFSVIINPLDVFEMFETIVRIQNLCLVIISKVVFASSSS